MLSWFFICLIDLTLNTCHYFLIQATFYYLILNFDWIKLNEDIHIIIYDHCVVKFSMVSKIFEWTIENIVNQWLCLFSSLVTHNLILKVKFDVSFDIYFFKEN